MSDFAPEYTKKEKQIILLKHLAWATPLMITFQYLFLPWLEEFTDQAQCYQYAGLTGTELIFYGVFVGLPLTFSLLVLMLEGTRSIAIIRLGQSPLPNEKVFKPTQYSYGVRARIKPVCVLLIVVFLVGFSIKGLFSAQQLISSFDSSKTPKCPSELSL